MMRGPDSAYLGVSMEKVIKASNSYFCKMHEMEVESGPGFPVQTFTLKKTFQHFLLCHLLTPSWPPWFLIILQREALQPAYW